MSGITTQFLRWCTEKLEAVGKKEVIAVTTRLTRQKFRDTDLLDRSHVVDDPRMLPEVVHRLIGAAGKPPQSINEGWVREGVEEGPEA